MTSAEQPPIISHNSVKRRASHTAAVVVVLMPLAPFNLGRQYDGIQMEDSQRGLSVGREQGYHEGYWNGLQ